MSNGLNRKILNFFLAFINTLTESWVQLQLLSPLASFGNDHEFWIWASSMKLQKAANRVIEPYAWKENVQKQLWWFDAHYSLRPDRKKNKTKKFPTCFMSSPPSILHLHILALHRCKMHSQVPRKVLPSCIPLYLKLHHILTLP